METKDLSFTLSGTEYHSETFTSTGGRTVAHLEREEQGTVYVSARLPGMQRWSLCAVFGTVSGSFAFEINLPAGVEVRVDSRTKVKAARILVEE